MSCTQSLCVVSLQWSRILNTGWLADPAFYIRTEEYFDLLHVDGEERFYKHNGQKYKKIYHLCKALHFHCLKMKDNAFPDFTTTGINFVNAIGEYIFKNWYQQNRADVHSIPDAKFLALVIDEKYHFLISSICFPKQKY